MSDISFEHMLSSQYTIFDGLAGMHVEDIYQDSRRLLWISTVDGGVSRFDSARFDNFGLKDGLPNLSVMTIAEGADGRMLFGMFPFGPEVNDFEPAADPRRHHNFAAGRAHLASLKVRYCKIAAHDLGRGQVGWCAPQAHRMRAHKTAFTLGNRFRCGHRGSGRCGGCGERGALRA